MVQVAEQSARHFGVAYYRRCYPKVQRARHLLATGRDRQARGCRTHKPHVVYGSGSRSWLVDPARAGGGPVFTSPPTGAVLNFWFGKPLRVTAQLSNLIITIPSTTMRQC